MHTHLFWLSAHPRGVQAARDPEPVRPPALARLPLWGCPALLQTQVNQEIGHPDTPPHQGVQARVGQSKSVPAFPGLTAHIWESGPPPSPLCP